MIDLSLRNDVYELALSNDPLNEIGTPMLAELERCLDEIRPEDASALIVHSTLKTGFSSGADLRELYRLMNERPSERHQSEMAAFLHRIHNVMNRLDLLPFPTIGVIHGICFGGGFELALTCDIRLAEPTARFCFPELRLGIIPCFGGIPRLKRDVGNTLVRDLLLTGRSINAKRAMETGVVSQMVGANEGLSVARRMALQMTKFDRLAAHRTKEFIKPVPHAELKREKEIMLELFSRPDVLTKLKKFVESTDVQPYLP